MGRQIAVALYHRDTFSEGHKRRVFGYEAFHWGAIVMPEPSLGRDCWTFEATDATEIDPVTFRMNNPAMEWWMREKNNADPKLSSKLLGMVVIGQAPDGLSYPQMLAIMKSVPLPIRHRHPQQSCVTWMENAILALQRQGWVSSFDVARFKDWALSYADERMKGEDSTQPKLVYYG